MSDRSSSYNKCTGCGACLENCPVFPWMKYSGIGGSALVSEILTALRDGVVSQIAYETILSCMGCGECASFCDQGIAPALFSDARRVVTRIPALRSQSLARWLPQNQYRISAVLAALQNAPDDVRWISRKPDNPRKTDIVVFLGCYMMAMPHVAYTLLDIMDRAGIDYQAVGGEGLCCGIGNMLGGDYDGARDTTAIALKLISAFKPDTVVFECGSCYSRFSSQEQLHGGYDFKSVLHTEFLDKILPKIKFTEVQNIKAAVHDSCDPRRGCGSYETLRRLLGKIPGIKTIELKDNRESSICCGGIANTTNPDVTKSIRRNRLEEAAMAGADVLTTACRNCYGALTGFSKGIPRVVHDIVLIGEAMGIKYEDRYSKLLSESDVGKLVNDNAELLRRNRMNPEEVKEVLGSYLNGLRE